MCPFLVSIILPIVMKGTSTEYLFLVSIKSISCNNHDTFYPITYTYCLLKLTLPQLTNKYEP